MPVCLCVSAFSRGAGAVKPSTLPGVQGLIEPGPSCLQLLRVCNGAQVQSSISGYHGFNRLGGYLGAGVIAGPSCLQPLRGSAGAQVQRRLFGQDLWRRFRIPPFVGRLVGVLHITMHRWRQGPANDRFQVPPALI